MANITTDEMRRFRETGLVNDRAFADLATLSRKMRLKRGETGFSAGQMKNFTLGKNECSPQVRDAILGYFENRVGELKKIIG